MDQNQYIQYLKKMTSEKTLTSKSTPNFLLEQVMSRTEIKFKLINFLRDNNYPDDDKIESFMREVNLDRTQFNSLVFEVLNDYARLTNINHSPDSDFNQKQLRMGTDIEMEHTPDDTPFYRFIAKSIAKDHLSEKGLENTYYTGLEKMEEDYKK